MSIYQKLISLYLIRTVTVLSILLSSFNLHAQCTFQEISEDLGIEHTAFMADYLTGGVALVDLNNDSYDDLFLIGGEKPDRLFYNDGNGKFTEVFNYADKDLSAHHSIGVIAGDINNDGWNDLFITAPEGHRNILLINEQNGKFTEISGSFMSYINDWSVSACFIDYDQDGLLDIYVGNYLEYEGYPFYSTYTAGIPNRMFRNNGDNTFTDVAASLGLADIGGTLAVLSTDFDRDGDQDLMVVNDFGMELVSNQMYENKYPETSFEKYINQPKINAEMYGMGVISGDYNRDGNFDYYISNLYENQLLSRTPESNFQYFLDFAPAFDLEDVGNVSWGSQFQDFDNDQLPDLVVTNGDMIGEFMAYYRSQNRIYRNTGDSWTNETSANFITSHSRSRGMAVGDFNFDGKVDIIFNKASYTYDKHPYAWFYKNTTENSNNFLRILLEGNTGNKSAIGAIVEVHANGIVNLQEVSSGGGYASQSSYALNFGLGTANVIDKVVIFWPGGLVQTLENLEINKYYKITEGSSGVEIPKPITPEDPVTSVQNNLIDINIYPNPASDYIFIEFHQQFDQKSLHLELYMPNGKRVESLQITPENGKFVLPTQKLFSETSFYLLRIWNNTFQYTSKVYLIK